MIVNPYSHRYIPSTILYLAVVFSILGDNLHDFGQLGWEFTPEMISMMALLGCEVSVDILSGGMVLDI